MNTKVLLRLLLRRKSNLDPVMPMNPYASRIIGLGLKEKATTPIDSYAPS